MDNNLIFSKTEYDLKLTKLDLENSEEVIFNDNEDNAQALFLRLIEGATKTINIISGQLKLYDKKEIVEALEKAIQKKVTVKILLDGEIYLNNKFLKFCLKNTSACTVRQSQERLKYHILTRDSKAYRYCKDINEHNAIASFNGSSIAKKSDNGIFKDEYSSYPLYRSN